MFGAGDNPKILDSIVGAITIEMMDVLRGKQFSPEMPLHYKTVLSHSLITVSDISVSLMPNPALGVLDLVAPAPGWVNYAGVAISFPARVVHTAHTTG